MRRFSLLVIIVLMAISLGLYAQEKDTAQVKPDVKLELVWEKEIPEGTSDIVFLDENGYNVFSSQCKDPEKALRQKRGIFVQDRKLKWFEDDNFEVVKEMAIGEGSTPNGSKVVISKNGRNIAIIEGLERWDRFKEPDEWQGGFKDKPATLRLLNWKGEELARTQFSPGGWEYIDLYPLGNDRTMVVGLAGGEGLYHGVKILVKKGKNLTEVFSDEETSWFVDYAENGERTLLLIKNKEMALFNGSGEEECRYVCPRPYRGGYLSPRGNYVVEHTAGEYLMIYDNEGNLIKEQHARCRYVAFSPDEKYLCVTPGPWRVYFFETKTGKMLWEYVDSTLWFCSIALPTEAKQVYISTSPFHPTSATAMEKGEKFVLIFERGKILRKIGPQFVTTDRELEFYRWESGAPPLKITSDGNYLLVRLPNRLLLYDIIKEGR